jgi:hypothetical protein
MYIVPIGWLYVTMMMAVVEATSDTGTVLGAIITFVLYGLLPTGIMAYLMATPARKRAIKAREATELAAVAGEESPEPDASDHAPTAAEAGTVPPVRKEP